MQTNTLISLVIPCYNEEDVLDTTIKRLINFFSGLQHITIELIFIDDGSRDQTFALLKNFAVNTCATKALQVKIIKFSRNFGHQLAITAGIEAAKGDAVVLLDADLQDPPELIQQMIDLWQKEKFDVVYGTRMERLGESPFKIITARLFYRLLNKLSDIPIPMDTGDFRLMSRNVVEALKAMPERARFVRGMVSWVGFRQIALPYTRAQRAAGQTKYPFKKMLQFAMDGILSFSIKPLQLAALLGICSASIALFGIIYVLFLRFFTNSWVQGWTALMLAILFIGGVQMISIGILGEYIGRIYNEVKCRPLYVVEEYIGFDKSTASVCDQDSPI